jgi:hypothetical protein
MILARLAILVFCAAACAHAEAKGVFQAQGRISEVRKNGDTVTFRFAGWITSGYATAPDSSPKRRWQSLRWEAIEVPVTLSDWTRPLDPERRDARPDVDGVHAKLLELAGTKVVFSVDNPGLQFSNKGQLMRVSGTYVYPRRVGNP